MEEYHIPVLYNEVIENLVIDKAGVYVDCTLGGGGHAEGILKSLSEKGFLIGIDQDEEAIKFASERLKPFEGNYKIFRNNFTNMDTVVFMSGYDYVDGILMDIGISSRQIDDEERGFSYRQDARLDMRMDNRNKISAYEVVNEYTEEKLSSIIYEYGEESYARKIAKHIVEARAVKKIETTFELSNLVERIIGRKREKYPAKKTFQAIRIEVNKELEVLTDALQKSVKLLKKGGRIGVITFHSLEDRIVKNFFKELEKGCICPPYFPKCVCGKKPELRIVTKKPIIPLDDEVKVNFRAHSAKLRIAERV